MGSVVAEPLVVTAPVTAKRTGTPGVGFPKASVTVAVTQCWVSTGSVAAGGVSVSVAGGPAIQVLAAPSLGSPPSGVPSWSVSA
jgi:hypothetical protein